MKNYRIWFISGGYTENTAYNILDLMNKMSTKDIKDIKSIEPLN